MRILLVDDDALLLRALSLTLRRHAITTALGGLEGLKIVRAGAMFDAIVCDCHMPLMSGRAFYETLSAEHPDLAARVVFMAGGFTKEGDAAFFLSKPTILKPFSAKDLDSVLERLTPVQR